jgi:imidazoleglycerol phosphate dehydratase HisB
MCLVPCLGLRHRRKRRAASTEEVSLCLGASMRMLAHEERGWITMKEAASLFSPMDESYAFGEMDEAGKHNLASFATKTGCDVELMPVQRCVYLTRHSS